MNAQTQSAVAPASDAFRFGRNWQRYLADYSNPERERIAADSLHSLLEIDLRDKTFLDIGCGSGLFSLCAHKAGAREVVSVDVDPDSVAATASLREREGAPDAWRVLHGSILDDDFVDGLDRADVVYSWGVLHHTGDMYAAIGNAARLVADGGTFAIAIYNKVTGRFLDSERWLRIKRAYNHAPRPAQVAMEWGYTAYFGFDELRSRKNPLRTAREYKSSRGMALRTDLIDWLGGYPYEFATVDELVRFCEPLGLRPRKVVELGPLETGNHELVFTKDGGT
jgi:2-polyprenyl-6-hydroxyphenyl methylase/3-demethylubiquinone-9 3-methyltransferase